MKDKHIGTIDQRQKELIREVQNKQKDLSVSKVSYSFGTLRDLYNKGNLIINPKFQRFFRWDKNQKSNFIESILLGLPIPPIFVSKKGDKRELVDGLQRLSTMFEFFGDLKSNISPDKSISMGLNATQYLPSLDGAKFGSMPNDLKFYLERNYNIDVIILEDSLATNDAKYELFYRLNTGGSSLSNQEVRSAIMIMENENFYDFFVALKNESCFADSIIISEKDLERQRDLELILRYFAIKNYEKQDGKIISTKNFLDKKSYKFLKKFDFEKERETFIKTFTFLNVNFESSPFRKFVAEEKRFKGRMNISAYDIIGSGLGHSIQHSLIDLELDKDLIIAKVKNLFSNEDFIKKTDVGITSEGKMNFSIQFGREYFMK